MLTHVVISGPPGAGKTTLARDLASPLSAACLSKDLLKEWLYAAMPTSSQEESLRLSEAAMSVMFGMAETAGAGALLDANWNPEIDIPKLRAIGRPLVQILCGAPADVLRHRVEERVRTGDRHPVHRDAMAPQVLAQMLEIIARGEEPLELGVPLLYLDTSVAVDLSSVTAWVETQQ